MSREIFNILLHTAGGAKDAPPKKVQIFVHHIATLEPAGTGTVVTLISGQKIEVQESVEVIHRKGESYGIFKPL